MPFSHSSDSPWIHFIPLRSRKETVYLSPFQVIKVVVADNDLHGEKDANIVFHMSDGSSHRTTGNEALNIERLFSPLGIVACIAEEARGDEDETDEEGGVSAGEPNRPVNERFHDAMLDLYARIVRQTKGGYTPAEFLRMVKEHGGYDAALDLIHREEPSSGYFRLYDLKRLELTVEAVVLKREWDELFSQEDRSAAWNRLQQFGYTVPAGDWRPIKE